MATVCASAYTVIVFCYTLTFQSAFAFFTPLTKTGGLDFAVFATLLHFSHYQKAR